MSAETIGNQPSSLNKQKTTIGGFSLASKVVTQMLTASVRAQKNQLEKQKH